MFNPAAARVAAGCAAAVLWALLFAGCGSAPSPTPPVVATATAAAPTATPVVLALPSETPTPPAAQPSDTPAPASTNTPANPRATPTRTPVPPSRPIATPTYTYWQAIPPVPPAARLPMRSPEYGIQAFMWWRPEIMVRDEELVREAGFTWIKQIFGWRDIEPVKGKFDWRYTDGIVFSMNQIGLNLLARLDFQPEWARAGCSHQGPPANYQDYANFVSAVATRYRGRIRAYQIWNEPNLSREWCDRPPNAVEYTRLLRMAYEAIKRADPNAWVISAGLSPTTRDDHVARPDIYFLQEMYNAGAGRYYDLLGVHGAGFRAPPEADPGEVARDPNLANPGDFASGVPEELRRIYCFRHVEDLRAVMVRNGDARKQVAVLEFGWTNDTRPDSPYLWHSVQTEEIKADYMVRAFQYARANWAPWIGLMSLIYISNPDWTPNDEQYWWAITNPDGTLRPAYHRLKAMAK